MFSCSVFDKLTPSWYCNLQKQYYIKISNINIPYYLFFTIHDTLV